MSPEYNTKLRCLAAYVLETTSTLDLLHISDRKMPKETPLGCLNSLNIQVAKRSKLN